MINRWFHHCNTISLIRHHWQHLLMNLFFLLLPLFHLDYKSSPLHETFTTIEKTWHSISVYLFIYKQISKQCSPAFEDVIAHTGPWYTNIFQDRAFIHQHQTHHLDWSGSSAARSFPYPTPPPSASLAGCSSSGTSLWGT